MLHKDIGCLFKLSTVVC